MTEKIPYLTVIKPGEWSQLYKPFWSVRYYKKNFSLDDALDMGHYLFILALPANYRLSFRIE